MHNERVKCGLHYTEWRNTYGKRKLHVGGEISYAPHMYP